MTRISLLVLISLAIALNACVPTISGSTNADIPTSIVEITPIFSTAISGVSIGTLKPVLITEPPPNYTPPPTPVPPTLTLIPPITGGLGPTELKYRLLAQFPDLFFCDPDYYPVARDDESLLAEQRFPELQANREEFDTILAHNNLAGLTSFTGDQKLLIYREHKKLAAIPFELAKDGYQFQIQIAKTEGVGVLVAGSIDSQGAITVQQQKPSIATCPICLAADTLIDTPSGPILVQSLRPGMLVWTMDKAGSRLISPLIWVSRTITPANHQIVHLVLDDGRELWISPGHPTADARHAGQLRAGDALDGAIVLSVNRVRYTGYATYDLLPGGDTGYYWANGILMASTLKNPYQHQRQNILTPNSR